MNGQGCVGRLRGRQSEKRGKSVGYKTKIFKLFCSVTIDL
jgi:hypothetical protein